jgi:hypothetical protein
MVIQNHSFKAVLVATDILNGLKSERVSEVGDPLVKSINTEWLPILQFKNLKI